MTTLRGFADDLRVGDRILHEGGETEVRKIDRSDFPLVITNSGAPDEITGYAWQYVEIRRVEKA